MVTVKIEIVTAEWEFLEEIPFKIQKIEELDEAFKLPFYDEEGEETESVMLPNCKVLLLHGEDDMFQVVIEKSLIRTERKTNDDENVIEYYFSLEIDKPLWQQGEEIGVFYPYETLPDEIKQLNIAKN